MTDSAAHYVRSGGMIGVFEVKKERISSDSSPYFAASPHFLSLPTLSIRSNLLVECAMECGPHPPRNVQSTSIITEEALGWRITVSCSLHNRRLSCLRIEHLNLSKPLWTEKENPSSIVDADLEISINARFDMSIVITGCLESWRIIVQDNSSVNL